MGRIVLYIYSKFGHPRLSDTGIRVRPTIAFNSYALQSHLLAILPVSLPQPGMGQLSVSSQLYYK